MKFFENRAVALVCAVLIVCGSTAWNVHRRIDKRADALEEVWEEKYGMEERLNERCENASQLWSILRNYDALSGECQRLRNAYNAMKDTDMDCDEAQKLFALNEELRLSSEAAMTKAGQLSLSAEDREWADRYYGNMVNAQRLLAEASYHEAQREFAELLNTPYLTMMKPFMDDDLPQKFA